MTSSLKTPLLFIFVILATAPMALAQTAGNIIAYPDAAGSTCGVVDAGGVVEVHLIHSNHSGATGSQFAMDVSDPGWTHLGDNWVVSTLGSSTTGVTALYGACTFSAVYLGSVLYLGTSAPCSQLFLASTPTPVSFDCGSSPLLFNTLFIGSANCGPCEVGAPYNLMPADGAVAVSLTPTLSWDWNPPTGCPEGIGLTISTVSMGTDPGSLSPVGWIDWNAPPFSLNVGPLLNYTTYYWRVDVDDSYWTCPVNQSSSQVQSFTTVGPVAVESSTWGNIKSLYR